MMERYLAFIKRPVYAVLIILTLAAGGFFALQKFSIDLLPSLNYPLLNVVTQYPGISPENVELLVTNPIEQQLQGIQGVRRTSSVSSMGISQVTVEFQHKFDIVTARQLVSAGLSNIAGTLPPNIHPEIDNLGSRLNQVIGYTFVNADVSQTELRQAIQYKLVPALRALDGISRIEVMGGARESITVEPDLSRLAQLNLSVQDIQQALEQNNINVSGSYLTRFHQDEPIQGFGQVQSIQDARDIFLKSTSDGTPVLLGDIATVRSDYLPEHYAIRSNQIPAVALMVQKQSGYSSVKLAHNIDKKIHSLNTLLPTETSIHKVYDQSEMIDESIHGVEMEMLLGAILAVLVLFYFLRRWKPTWTVATTIPLSMMLAMILMYLSGFSLNMMTMAALTLAIGMVVDDAIIVMENIERNRIPDQPVTRSIAQGVRQIAAADISGTITTIIVFVPLLFLTGFVGQIVVPFGATISYTLVASLGLSLIFIPLLIHWQGGHNEKAPEPPKMLTRFMTFNDKIFDYVFRHKIGVILTVILLLISSVAGVALLNSAGMLPPLDEGALLIEYVLPPGTSLQESKQIGSRESQIIEDDPAIETVFLKIGSPENTYYIENVNRGEFLIKLKPKNQRSRSAVQILADLQTKLTKIPGVSFLFHQPTQENIDESFSGLPAFFGITLVGSNQDSLVAYSKDLESVATETSGINNLVNNAKIRVPQIQVTPRRDRLAAYQLSVDDVMNQMSVAFQGSIAGYFLRNQVPIALFVRLRPEDRNNLESLRDFPIRLRSGQTMPLGELCDIRTQDISPTITHLNGHREITMTSEISGNLFKVVHDLRAGLAKIHLPGGYSVEIRGQYQTLLKTALSFLWVIIFAVVLVYIVLYIQFDSFWQPFVILLKIPMDFVGAFIALLITRQQLNISVAIGLLTLVGIAVNNAIVLIDFTNKFRQQDATRIEALREAVHIRTRPILMTGLTTIFGLLPAAIGSGIGSKIHQPFAITLIGGLLVGMLLSLNVIPILYDTLARWFEKS